VKRLYSVEGAVIGALAGAVLRGSVIPLHLMALGAPAALPAALFVPSAVLGALSGGIAGATGHPGRGAVVGALLSAGIYLAFWVSCLSLLSGCLSDSEQAQGWVVAVEMAVAGAIAGAVGGLAGSNMAGPEEGPPSSEGGEGSVEQVPPADPPCE
jgi:hypothetical protein